MPMAWRINAIALGMCVVLFAGCKDSASSPSAAPSSGAPSRGGDGAPSKGDGAYAKKLVGVWEGKEPGEKGKDETVTLEFKGDGGMSIDMGPFKLKGTYKVTKEEGKTVMIDTEMTIDFGDLKAPAPPKPDKKAMKVVFDDDNTITVSQTEKEPDPKTFKRKK
jgi:hypothetical protein